jgi:hypothetical protein
MRNQALTEQVEVQSTTTSFIFDLELMAEVSDADNDGLPDDWENLHDLSTDDDGSVDINNGPDGDPDLDGLSNYVEWLVGLNPRLIDNSAFPKLGIDRIQGGVRLSFPTLPGRSYQLRVSEELDEWEDFGSPFVTLPGDAPAILEIDDTTGLSERFYRMSISAAP